MRAAPLVSVIVPNYNGEKILPQCLASIRAQDYDLKEVIVVDDGSTDASEEIARSQFPEFNWLPLPQNVGFSGACNAGAAAARGEYLALVNTDVVLPPDFLSRMAAALESRPAAWVAAAFIDNADRDMHAHPHATSNSLTGLMINDVFGSSRAIFAASGAALMFRRQVGRPFDPDYRFFHEDVFLSWRAWLTGHEVVYLPEVRVSHLGSATLGAQRPKVQWLLERNRWLNTLTFWSLGTLLRLSPLLLCMLLVEHAVDLWVGRGWWWRWRAYGWILAHLPLVLQKRRKLQAERRVPDATIIRLMSCRVTNADGIAGRLLNRLARGWCRIAGLRSWELQ